MFLYGVRSMIEVSGPSSGSSLSIYALILFDTVSVVGFTLLRLSSPGGPHYVDLKESVPAVFYGADEGATRRETDVAVLDREGSFCTYAVIASSHHRSLIK